MDINSRSVVTRMEQLTQEISYCFDEIAKKTTEISTILSKTSDYWEGVEKLLKARNLTSLQPTLSTEYRYFKSACLSYSASLARPSELFKTSLNSLFKNTKKNLDPIYDVTHINSLDDSLQEGNLQILCRGVQKAVRHGCSCREGARTRS